MLESFPSTTPLVPSPEEIQHGYELPCRDLTVAGAQIRLFTVPGASTNPEQTLLCLPGLGASGRSFALLAALKHRQRFLFWTPPTKTPPSLSPLWYNVETLQHSEAPLPPRFALLGSSFGSLIATAFALQNQERVRALILCNPVVSSRRIRKGALLASSMLRIPLPFAYLFAPMVARVLGGRHLPPEGRAEIVREARRISPVEMGRRLRDILASDLLPELGKLKVPTLIVHGSRDRVVPLSAARDVAQHLPNARLEVIRGAAHLPYMSHPTEFNRLVQQFLKEALRPGPRPEREQPAGPEPVSP
jgi:pimeloyl-ACP methyl ester carboxylesterase